MRHIIVEGPDGSGKSSLITHLTESLGLDIHERASTSRGGPVDRLAEWVERDIHSYAGVWRPFIYDRHPVISEPIYGRVVRNDLAPRFEFPGWLIGCRLQMYSKTIVVFCMPPLDVVQANVQATRDSQMPGVLDRIRDVYLAYNKAIELWGGLKYTYDYTQGGEVKENLSARLMKDAL